MSWVYLVIAALFEMAGHRHENGVCYGCKSSLVDFCNRGNGLERIFFVPCTKTNPDRNGVCGLDGNWNARNIFCRNNIVSRRC